MLRKMQYRDRSSWTSPRAVGAVGMFMVAFVLAVGASQPAQAQTFTVLHAFTETNGDGDQPLAGVTLDTAGNLYGTTFAGGDLNCDFTQAGCGIVFKISKSGKESVLYSFTGDADGRAPMGHLIRDTAGNLYGTVLSGGDPNLCSANGIAGCGTVFKISRSGKETVLYKFTGENGDGEKPQAGLIRDAMGNLYGTAARGGNLTCPPPFGCGTVFKVDAHGHETVLYRFTNKHNDGNFPLADLVLDAAGNLYGTTLYGGDLNCRPPVGCGIVFKISRGGKETVLHAFTGKRDGETPTSGVIRETCPRGSMVRAIWSCAGFGRSES